MNLKALQESPEEFRRALMIDADGQTVRLGEKLDEWQREDFAALDPGWRTVAGQKPEGEPKLRAWLERPRGHSKTSDLAASICWALFASKRTIRGIAAAADKDQAALLKTAIQTLVRANPWLERILCVTAWRVENLHTGSTLEIISSDAASSYGHLVDFIVADEVCHWANRDLFDSLLSSAAKKANCLFLCISNAGFAESWQWQVREAVRQDAAWHFSRLDGPRASWITPDRLAEQRRLLPKIAFDRLWMNQWSAGIGDALSETDITSALRLSGPLSLPEKGWCYFAGLDIGLSRDAASLCVVGKHIGFSESHEKPRTLTRTQEIRIECGLADEPLPEYDEVFQPGTGRLKLCRLNVWRPTDSATGKVKIEEIESMIVALSQRFRLRIGVDPWQAAYLVQRLQDRDAQIEPINFTADNLKSMCSATLEAFSEANLDLYADPDLLRDLRGLKVVEKSYGVRLDSVRGINGHGDSATALAISLHLAKICQTDLSFSADRRLICWP